VNILIDQLPTSVEIDGQEYEVNSDFRDCLRVIMAFEDPELAQVEKQIILLSNLYLIQPDDPEKALSVGLKFLDGGKEKEEAEELAFSPRVFSFSKDANLIFAAFQQTHGIDLSTVEYMHWWKFMALFLDLGDTTFCNLVGLRKRIKTGKATADDRIIANEIGDMLYIPEVDDRSIEERDKADEFLRKLEEGKKRRS
jgi:hypothetical protein